MYQSVWRITGHKVQNVRTVRDKNESMLTHSKLIKNRWKDHFEQLYNPVSTVDRSILDELYASDQHHVVTASLLRSEVENAINRMKIGKVPWIDNITAEEIIAADDA